MEHINKFENWTSSSTDGNEWDLNNNLTGRFQYVSKDKKYFGIHNVFLSKDDKKIEVRAKFDTGANSSSIDYTVAIKLGISRDLIKRAKYLEKCNVPKNITFFQQNNLEKRIYLATKKEFTQIKNIKLVKSSSGFSFRIFIELILEYDKKSIKTTVNLRDRGGLTCPMLIGLKDML